MEWNACTLEPNFALRWVECHPGLSGYLQAAGVLITLGLALYIPMKERSREHAQTARRAVSILSSLLGEMVSLQAEVDRARTALDRQLVTPPGGLNYLPWFAEITVIIPLELSKAVNVLSDFPGPSAETVVDAIAAARSYNGHVARYRTVSQSVSGRDWFDLVTMMKGNLALVDEEIASFFKVLDSRREDGRTRGNHV